MFPKTDGTIRKKETRRAIIRVVITETAFSTVKISSKIECAAIEDLGSKNWPKLPFAFAGVSYTHIQ